MIIWTRTSTIAPGKLREAMVWSKSVNEIVGGPGSSAIEVQLPIAGCPMRVRWMVRHESLAAFEQSRAALMQNPKWLEHLAAGQPYFLPGSQDDEIWQSV